MGFRTEDERRWSEMQRLKQWMAAQPVKNVASEDAANETRERPASLSPEPVAGEEGEGEDG